MDETASIGSGKLIWHSHALEQFLGRSPCELAAASSTVLKYLEHRLLFLKVTLMFGWSADVGRLVVFEVVVC